MYFSKVIGNKLFYIEFDGWYFMHNNFIKVIYIFANVFAAKVAIFNKTYKEQKNLYDQINKSGAACLVSKQEAVS
jgi:hypothetical protein